MANLRALVHGGIGWTTSGGVALATCAVTFGGETVRLKVAEAASAIYADDNARTAIVIAAITLFLIWLATKPSVWEWVRRFRRQPPSLYLTNIIHYPDLRGKMVGVSWNPDQLNLEIRGDLPYHSWPPGEAKEAGLNFNGLSAETDDLRHVHAIWEIPKFDIVEAVQADNFFGLSLRSITKDRLSLQTPQRAVSMPLATKCKSDPIPVIRPNEPVTIRAPEAFANALAIFLLLKARRFAKENEVTKPWDTDDILSATEGSRTIFDGIRLSLTFVRGDRRCRQDFRVRGILWKAQMPISTKPGDDGSFGHLEGGVSTVLDYLEVVGADD